MNDNTQGRNHLAAFFMLAAIVMYSLFPVVIKWGVGHEFPFLFIAAGRLIVSIMLGFLLWCFYKEFMRAVKGIIKDNIIKTKARIHVFIFTLSFFDYGLFAISAKFLDYAAVAVIYEMWVIMFVFYTAYLYRHERRYKFNISTTVFLTLLAFGGVVFVLISQHEEIGFSGNYKNLFYGGGLAFFAAVLACLGANGMLWATKMKDIYRADKELSTNTANAGVASYLRDQKKVEVLFVVTLYGIGSGVFALLSVLIGVVAGEDVGKFVAHTIDRYWLPILAFGIIGVVAGILWRASNLITTNLSINAISYLTPIFTITFLWISFGVGIERLDLFIIGTIAIIVANLLINFAGSVRRSYKSLIIGLWGFGTWTYLAPVSTVDIEAYFQIIAIVATMYILLVSFRLDRLVRRTTSEEELSLELAEKISAIIWAERKMGKKASETYEFAVRLRSDLVELDSMDEPTELSKIYNRAKRRFRVFYKRVLDGTAPDIERLHNLHDMENDFNKYVHSKQQGHNFGEFITLGILGLIIIAVLMLSSPGISAEGIATTGVSLTIFSIKVFAMLVSATVVFLFFNIWDLQADRREKIMGSEKRGKTGGPIFGILFRDTQKRNFEQGLSIVVCITIVLTYSGLFYDKWVMNGWF